MNTKVTFIRDKVCMQRLKQKNSLHALFPHYPYRDKEYITFCVSGYRSAIAASLLRKAGYKVKDINRGFAAVSVYSPSHTTTGSVRRAALVDLLPPPSHISARSVHVRVTSLPLLHVILSLNRCAQL